MAKVESLEALRALREELKAHSLINLPLDETDHFVVSVGLATCGIAAGGEDVMAALKDEAEKAGIADRITFVSTGCRGYCYMEPLIEVREPGKSTILYGEVTPEKARRIIREHLMEGKLLEQCIIGKKVERA